MLREMGHEKPRCWYHDFERDCFFGVLTREWWAYAWGSWVEWPFFRLLMALGLWEKQEACTLRSGWWVWPPKRPTSKWRRGFLPIRWWWDPVASWCRNIFGPDLFRP